MTALMHPGASYADSHRRLFGGDGAAGTVTVTMLRPV